MILADRYKPRKTVIWSGIEPGMSLPVTWEKNAQCFPRLRVSAVFLTEWFADLAAKWPDSASAVGSS
jgi:hypothetical protein